ncbi:heavy metal transport/detoxification protein [Tenacibaculum sp. Bg11-29]|uniref:cation transporter n=1 Tax=Tenacibaculum sp. Bg11-29 TaxID=2058306 RepID=UPI000C34671D|nr:heavy metal-associated domain-containing protein [Tenacibaculum sp. Bg11-29]PKH49807.1 heavy metal transport/detoxification protein [Tenacibaculum sp. Bg11-29]
MKIQKIVLALALVSFLAVGCKNEAKKEDVNKEQKTEVAANTKELSLNISGMTCEIGCAKKIASDLSKKEGVLDAKVVFNDSIATVKYDSNITNKTDLIAFVEGIGSGDMYKASETSKKACTAKTDAEKEACKKKAACKKGKTDEKACATDCKKECCAETTKA